MPNISLHTTVNSYFKTIQEILDLESKNLTCALPHHGERGRTDEERLRDFLRKVLPRRFCVGTGFLVCSKAEMPPSSQTDIVISDEFQNSQLHRAFSAFMYPVEMVSATIEVKSTLNITEFEKTLRDIAKIRRMAKWKYFLKYRSVAKNPKKKEERVVEKHEFRQRLPPRSFLFAYRTRYKTVESLRKRLAVCLTENRRAHLHGLVVLERDWHFTQEDYTGKNSSVKSHERNALLRFTRDLLDAVSSMPMNPMAIDRYLLLDG